MANQKNVTRKGVRAMMHPKPGRDPREEGRPKQDASADYDLRLLPTIEDLRQQLRASRDPKERTLLKAALFTDTYGLKGRD